MITIIEGRETEKKIALAGSMSKGKTRMYMNPEFIKGGFALYNVSEDTEVIIVTNIQSKDFERIYHIFRNDKLVIDKRGEDPYYIDTPDVILIRL
tara:strand:- start:21 stop:305 length:285 start_codon:yes stop_codon:yes gene_type:complete